MTEITKQHRGFDETATVPIPQRNPLEVSQKGTNEKINTMLKFSENLIMQNIKMKKIITGLADRIAKLESMLLNGKLQKTIDDTILKREKATIDASKRITSLGKLSRIMTPSEPPPLMARAVELSQPEINKNTDFNEQIRALAQIQQTKTPGQESTQNLMEALQEHKMLTTPDVATLAAEHKEESDSDSSNIHGASSISTVTSETGKDNSESSSIVFVDHQKNPPEQVPAEQTTDQAPAEQQFTEQTTEQVPVEQQSVEQVPVEQQTQTITETKTSINVVSDDLILELEPIETQPVIETKQHVIESTTEQPHNEIKQVPTETDTQHDTQHDQQTQQVTDQTQDQTQDAAAATKPEIETNPLIASSRRRKKKGT